MSAPQLGSHDPLAPATQAKLDELRNTLRRSAPLIVAYSGGVDSSCLLAVAARELGAQCTGVIADSPSLPRRALQKALEQASEWGVSIELLETKEFENPDYSANSPQRCYFCKAEMFQKLQDLAQKRGIPTLAYGENADDLPAQRPGSRAAAEFRVLSPLRQVGLSKAEVREIARHLGLSSADLPAAPCLSSRVQHGIPVQAEYLAAVEQAEAALHERGYRILRVRVTGVQPLAAKVQVSPEETARLLEEQQAVGNLLNEAGFHEVEFDHQGYRGAGLH